MTWSPYTNMMADPSLDRLHELLRSQKVVDLPTMQATLGGVSSMTVFRHLRAVAYRRSYNHNGRYYTLYDPARFDRHGLWSFDEVHFSVDSSLRKTVRRLIEQAEAGATHQELHQRLQVRAHNTLLALLRDAEVERERMGEVYVYLHTDPHVRAAQRQRREEMLANLRPVTREDDAAVSDYSIIQVLLVLIHHRGAGPQEVARRLRGHSPPIPLMAVRAVFARYQLDDIGKKGGRSNC
jgi:hypothetical protein